MRRIDPKPVCGQRLDDVLMYRVDYHHDGRGWFCESWSERAMPELATAFVQDNHSMSNMGVVRGLHYQIGDGQAKLVRCTNGSIMDVVLDLRRDSQTFGKWASFCLGVGRGEILWVPVGFAHGFVALEEDTHVQYKVDRPYRPELERGVNAYDPALRIVWGQSENEAYGQNEAARSVKDAALPCLEQAEIPDTWRKA